MNDHWISRLSDYLDKDLTPAEHAACEAHLQICDTCRTALAEIEALVKHARTLPEHTPATDLWPDIAARLHTDDQAMRDSAPFWADRRITLSVPQLALAASVVIAVSAGVSWFVAERHAAADPQAHREPAIHAVSEPFAPISDAQHATFADAQFDAAISDLERILIDHRDTLDPRTVRVLERNLTTIDEAIAQARAALDADPANPFLNAHLVDARQRKLNLLRRAALLTDDSDEGPARTR
jgi:negative regulator of sigma E activity